MAAIAGVIHYYMHVKADMRQPWIFAAVLAVQLGNRLLVCWRRPKPVKGATAQPKEKGRRGREMSGAL